MKTTKFLLAALTSVAMLGGCALLSPDDNLNKKVTAALKADEHVGKFDITPTSKDGEVTLNGTVANDFQQYQAGAVAQKVDGVKKVDNKVKVK